MPGKAREGGKWEGGDRKGEASLWFGQFAAGVWPVLPEGGTRRKQKMRSALPARVSQLWGGEEARGERMRIRAPHLCLHRECSGLQKFCSAKIWVCSRSDFPPGLEVQVREQGKDGGQESQRCFEESETPEGFALATFLFVTHPAESCALRVSLLVPGRLPFGPALH